LGPEGNAEGKKNKTFLYILKNHVFKWIQVGLMAGEREARVIFTEVCAEGTGSAPHTEERH
jgi:hypothetical protein